MESTKNLAMFFDTVEFGEDFDRRDDSWSDVSRPRRMECTAGPEVYNQIVVPVVLVVYEGDLVKKRPRSPSRLKRDGHRLDDYYVSSSCFSRYVPLGGVGRSCYYYDVLTSSIELLLPDLDFDLLGVRLDANRKPGAEYSETSQSRIYRRERGTAYGSPALRFAPCSQGMPR